jgi:hypothetical protein
MNIAIHETLREASYDEGSRLLSGVILQAGLSRNGNYYPADTIARAAEQFVGVKCFIDHPRSDALGERSIRDVCGVVEQCGFADDKLRALIRISEAHDWIASMTREGILGDVSINALGRTKLTRRDGRVVREVTEISRAYSVDFVTDAAAGGRVEALLRESAGYAEALRLIENMTLSELKASRPDLVERISGESAADPSDNAANHDGAAEHDETGQRDDATDHDGPGHDDDERRRLVESVLVRRNLPDDVSQYLRGLLHHLAADDKDATEHMLNEWVEDHLEYLGRLNDAGRIHRVSTSDPLARQGAGAKASTFRFLGIRPPA